MKIKDIKKQKKKDEKFFEGGLKANYIAEEDAYKVEYKFPRQYAVVKDKFSHNWLVIDSKGYVKRQGTRDEMLEYKHHLENLE